MELFQQSQDARPRGQRSGPRDDKLCLLTRLEGMSFDHTFRGLEPQALRRLFESVTAHEPCLRSGLRYHRLHGQWPIDAEFKNSVAALESVSSDDLPSAFRGYDPMQVERVLKAIRQLPAHMDRD